MGSKKRGSGTPSDEVLLAEGLRAFAETAPVAQKAAETKTTSREEGLAAFAGLMGTNEESGQAATLARHKKLQHMFDQHALWVKSAGVEGERLELHDFRFPVVELAGLSLEGARFVLVDFSPAVSLAEANLKDCHFAHCCFDGQTLSSARFAGASLIHCSFVGTLLQNSDFSGARLSHCQFQHNAMSGARFDGARLTDSNFTSASLQEACFDDASVRTTVFQKCHLDNASFVRASLVGDEFWTCYLARARFREADLSVALFIGSVGEDVDLRGVRALRADFSHTSLSGADFSDAECAQINLTKATLSRCRFVNARLGQISGFDQADTSLCDFSGASGFLGDEFRGKDTAGMRLPNEIAAFEALKHVEDTTKDAKQVFFAQLIFGLWALLSLANFQPGNPQNIELPILSVEVDRETFTLIAPLLLVVLYFYFHLYVLRLWRLLDNLPAIFPDGRPVDSKTHPWLFVSLVYFRQPVLISYRSLQVYTESTIAVLLGWVFPLLVLGAFLRITAPISNRVELVGQVVIFVVAGAAGLVSLAQTFRRPKSDEITEEIPISEVPERRAAVVSMINELIKIYRERGFSDDPKVKMIGKNLWQIGGEGSIEIAKEKVRAELGDKALSHLENLWLDVKSEPRDPTVAREIIVLEKSKHGDRIAT